MEFYPAGVFLPFFFFSTEFNKQMLRILGLDYPRPAPLPLEFEFEISSGDLADCKPSPEVRPRIAQ